MALYNIWATFSHTNMDIQATSMLQTGWVLLSNIPDKAMNVEAITLIAELEGDVIAVDEVSVIRAGPVRVRMQAREIEKINGYIQIFVEGVGYEIRFSPENSQQTNKPPPQPPRKNEDDMTDDDEDDLLDSDEERARKHGKVRKEGSNNEETSDKGKQTTESTRQKSQATSEGEFQSPLPISMLDPVSG
ncbi:unnamed protein product [Urochloa humidicola]